MAGGHNVRKLGLNEKGPSRTTQLPPSLWSLYHISPTPPAPEPQIWIQAGKEMRDSLCSVAIKLKRLLLGEDANICHVLETRPVIESLLSLQKGGLVQAPGKANWLILNFRLWTHN